MGDAILAKGGYPHDPRNPDANKYLLEGREIEEIRGEL